MNGDAPKDLHLDDPRLQGLAEGSLRGPEGAAARAHCEACPACGRELAELEALLGQLATLTDPPPPEDFTLGVLLAIDAREEQLAARRHIRLAAIPAALVGLVAVIGWAFSAGPGQRLDELVRDLTVVRQIYEVARPLFSAARVPLAVAAIACAAAIGVLLRSTLRRAERQATTR